MTRKLTTFFTASVILAGLGTATAVLAEGIGPSSPPSQPGPSMMGDHGGMMSMMGQMNPDQMKQMSQMVDNCNRMMGSMTTTHMPKG